MTKKWQLPLVTIGLLLTWLALALWRTGLWSRIPLDHFALPAEAVSPSPLPSTAAAPLLPDVLGQEALASASASAARPQSDDDGSRSTLVTLGAEAAWPAIAAAGGLESTSASLFDTAGVRLRITIAPDLATAEGLFSATSAEPPSPVLLLPLPLFAVSYARLRALEPAILAVVFWSSGSEVLQGPPNLLTAKATQPVRVQGARSSTEEFLALWALAQTGQGLAPATASSADAATLVALRAPEAAAESPQLLSTGSATRLVPWVLVGRRAESRASAPTLSRLVSSLLLAERRLHDLPSLEQATRSGWKGAPSAAVLVAHLSRRQGATLRDNAELFQWASTLALPVGLQFQRAFEVWAWARLIDGAAPVVPPVERLPIGWALRQAPGEAAALPSPPLVPPRGESRALLRRVVPGRPSDEQLVTELGELAEIFPASDLQLRVQEGGRRRTDLLLERAASRFHVQKLRLRNGWGTNPLGPLEAGEAELMVLAPR